MGVIVNEFNEAENEVEEVGLQRKRGIQRSTSSSSSSSNEDTEIKGGGLDFEMIRTETEVNTEMIHQNEDAEYSTILPASDPPLPEVSTSLSNVTYEIGVIGTMKENDKERQELYLEKVFQKPPTHGFYCPNCKSCIQKVYIQKGDQEQTSASTEPVRPIESIRCSSCFSFLIPIGNWLGLISSEDRELNDEVTDSSNYNRQPEGSAHKVASQHEASVPSQPEPLVNQSVTTITSKLPIKISESDDKGKHTLESTEEVVLLGKGPEEVSNLVDDKITGKGLGSILTNIPGSNMEAQDSSNHFSDTLQDHGKGQVAQKKKYFWNNWAVIGGAVASKPKETKTGSSKHSEWKVIGAASGSTKPKEPEIDFPDEKQPQHVEVKIDEVHTEQEVVPAESTALLAHREVPPVPARNLGPEILKSIVYGGLTESVASLSVVTSAASADATTLNIVTLAMANLMGGLFVLLHNLAELKAEKPRRAENHTDAQVDQYNELLGQRKHFILHAFIAILSFIVFGLVPPLVYGFSFNESDDKDFKLAAVAGASLLCITLLSIAKAHTKRPNNCFTYFQTVLYYVTTGALASLLSYLAGVFVKKLMQKLGWFQTPSNFAMQIPRISVLQQQPSMKDK